MNILCGVNRLRVGVCLNECTRKGWNLGDRQPGEDAPYRRIIFGWNLMSKHLVFPQPEEAEVRPQPLWATSSSVWWTVLVVTNCVDT